MAYSCSGSSNGNGSVSAANDARAAARRCRLAVIINLLLALFATLLGIVIGTVFAAAISPYLVVLIILGLIALILLIAAIVWSTLTP